MSIHSSIRFTLATLFIVGLPLPAFAQDTEIRSWTAPPYWAPPASENPPDRQDTRLSHGRVA
jgi:hypothetical protein